MDVGLEINMESFSLGDSLDVERLRDASLKKLGFLVKQALSRFLTSGDEVYFSKNPMIELFGGEARLCPMSGAQARALGIVNGTSCYIIYNRNKIRHIICQVVGNAECSDDFLRDARGAASRAFGAPDPSKSSECWSQDGQIFFLEPCGANGKVHWKTA